MSLSIDDIRKQLRAVVDGHQPIRAFEEWLLQRSWNLHLTEASQDVQDLAHALDHDLATRQDNDALVAKWRVLAARLDTARVTFGAAPMSVTLASGTPYAMFHRASATLQAAPEDVRPLGAL